jgi:hypothetical protein
MELKEQLTDDLNNKSFLYYPCCGMDFKIIPELVKFTYSVRKDSNFIFIDANNENANGFISIEFLENKLGLANLEIVEKQTFRFDENFYSEVAEILNCFEQSESNNINDFIKGIKKPKAIRFVLKNENTDFVLYYIYFEAVTIIEYINRLNLGENFKGLLICAPGVGWTGYTELVTKLISVANPQYIIDWEQNGIDGFDVPIPLSIESPLWLKFKSESEINNENYPTLVRAYNALKFC